MNAPSRTVIALALLSAPCFAQCVSPWAESFDTTFTTTLPPGFSRSSTSPDFAWRSHFGPTSTQLTGPNFDYPAGTGRYLYTEASGAVSGNSATLNLPCTNLSGIYNPHLQFALHMRGPGMGSLIIEAETTPGNYQLLTSRSGHQGDDWLEVSVPLSPRADGTVRVRLVAIRGTGPTSDVAIDEMRIGSPVAPTWQLNQPSSSLTFGNEVVPTSSGPKAVTTRYIGGMMPLTLSSLGAGRDFDLIFAAESSVPANAGGLVTIGLQALNLDFFSSTFRSLHGGVSGIRLVPWPGDTTLPVLLPSIGTLSAQLLVTDPALPDGYALSQAGEAVWTQDECLAAQPLGLGDDTFATLGTGFSVPFYGTNNSQVFVTSNGFITFGIGRTTWPLDAQDLRADVPSIAPLASDLDPSNGGEVRFFSNEVDRFCVVYEDVASYGVGGANTVSVIFDLAVGVTFRFGANISQPIAIVGISPGGGWSRFRSLDLSALPVPLGTQDMPYEMFTAGVDLANLDVVFELDPFGFPMRATN